MLICCCVFVSLQRDQMLAAHEMFKNANRVSRAEKALILGFMAGARGKEQQSTVLCVKTPRSIAGYFERERERVREGVGGVGCGATTPQPGFSCQHALFVTRI